MVVCSCSASGELWGLLLLLARGDYGPHGGCCSPALLPIALLCCCPLLWLEVDGLGKFISLCTWA